MSATPAYDELCRAYTRIHRYNHLAAIVGWDRNAMMPPKGNEARAAAEAELERADPPHAHRSAPRRVAARGRGASRSTTSRAPTCARYGATGATPTRCPSRWSRRRRWPAPAASTRGARQRAANDWNGFLENFREVVRLAREEAQLLADDTGLSRYDALMDRYEPGVRAADIDRIFGDVKAVAART